jgi:hypothetical protein
MFKILILIVLIGAAIAVFRAYAASQQESREARTLRSLPPSVQHVVARMDPQGQAALFNEYEAKRKKTSVGYLLWLVGFHYLYYSKVGLFFAYWLTGGGAGFWTLADLFRMPSIARAANEQVARQALHTLSPAAFNAPQMQPPAPTAPDLPAASSHPLPGPTEPVWRAQADALTPPSPPETDTASRWPTGALPPPAIEPDRQSGAPPLPAAAERDPAWRGPPPTPIEPGSARLEPGSTRSKPYLIVGGIAVVALALATVALVIVVQPHSAPVPAAVQVAQASPSIVTDQLPGSSAPSGPTPVTTTASPLATATVGITDISNVATDPRASQIRQTLDAYFSGINQKNYQQSLSVVDPALVDSSAPNQVANFEKGLSTTNDSNISVGAIYSDPQAPSGVSVSVTFQSTQDPRLGPDGEACTKWNLKYLLSGPPEGSFRLYTAHGDHTAC